MMRLASQLVVFSLLTSAATAHAECAWVLWNTDTKKGSESITDPFDTFTTKWECDQALQRWQVREEDRRRKDPTTRYYYRCFPDTVDPRGPKTK